MAKKEKTSSHMLAVDRCALQRGGGTGMCMGGMGRGIGREGGRWELIYSKHHCRNLIFRSKCAKNILRPGYARPAGESKRFLRRIKPLGSREWNTPHSCIIEGALYGLEEGEVGQGGKKIEKYSETSLQILHF